MSLFSKNLRYLRKKGNHNQDEIALLFRKRANTIGNWENQKSEPSLTELMKLGEFFKVSVEDLLHTDMEKSPEPRPYKVCYSGSFSKGAGDILFYPGIRAYNDHQRRKPGCILVNTA